MSVPGKSLSDVQTKTLRGKWRRQLLISWLDDIRTEFVEVILARVNGTIVLDLKPSQEGP